MRNRTFLLPAGFKPVGIVFFALGVVTGFIRFYLDVKPKLLNLKVFAVYSAYIDEKFLKIVNNNLGEELTIFLLISGLFIFALSREKHETVAIVKIRYQSMLVSFYLGFAFLMAANFFTFGFAFLYMLVMYSGVPLVAFILVFQIQLLRLRKNDTTLNATQTPENES